jgi:TM2 domain-containing membrane protein YozV
MSRDLRQYARQTNFRLVAGFFLVLFIIGDGLIYLFFGREAAIMGLICLVAGIAPIILILLALWIIDWIVRRNNPE